MSKVVPFPHVPRRAVAPPAPPPSAPPRAPRDPLTPDECRMVLSHRDIDWPDDMWREAMEWMARRMKEIVAEEFGNDPK